MDRLTIVFLDYTLTFLGKLAYGYFHCFGWAGVRILSSITTSFSLVTKKSFKRILNYEINILKAQLPGWQIADDLIRRTLFQHYSRHVETIFLGALTQEKLDKLAYATGVEYIEQSLLHGKGIILLLSHFGSFLLPLPFLGFRGYRVCQITGKQDHESAINQRMWSRVINERIWHWRKKQADKIPVQFTQVDNFLRPVFKALLNNQIIAIAFDGRESSKWVTVNFLGGKERFSPGPFELARRTGATIIPTFVIRENTGRHKIIFEPPFVLSNDLDPAKANVIDTQEYSNKFGEYIKEKPCHFAVHLSYLKKNAAFFRKH